MWAFTQRHSPSQTPSRSRRNCEPGSQNGKRSRIFPAEIPGTSGGYATEVELALCSRRDAMPAFEKSSPHLLRGLLVHLRDAREVERDLLPRLPGFTKPSAEVGPVLRRGSGDGGVKTYQRYKVPSAR